MHNLLKYAVKKSIAIEIMAKLLKSRYIILKKSFLKKE
jgi:hypothetical protein